MATNEKIIEKHFPEMFSLEANKEDCMIHVEDVMYFLNEARKDEADKIIGKLEDTAYLNEFDNDGCLWFNEEEWLKYIEKLRSGKK